MLEVQSIKSIIAGQLAAILLPFVALVAYLAVSDAQRTAELERRHFSVTLAQQARERYTAFTNGAADAVDTGRLSLPALDALELAQQRLQRLHEFAPEPGLEDAIAQGSRMATALRVDAGLGQLERLRPQIDHLRHTMARLQSEHELAIDGSIRGAIARGHRNQTLVAALSLALLALTLWFIRRMVRDLSQPLRFAASVADRIAQRGVVEDREFDERRDIGNLLSSLARMNQRLRAYQNEVQAYQRGLEEKVRFLPISLHSLDQAQRVAQLGSWQWERDEARVFWSDEMYRLLGCEPGGVEPGFAAASQRLSAELSVALRSHLRQLVRRAGSLGGEQRLRHADGSWRVLAWQIHSHAQAGPGRRIPRLSGTVQDVTERREAEAQMHRLAVYDSLTGLPNRVYFLEQLDKAIARARRAGSTMAALFIDLDRFKRVNDTFGHAAGDALLKQAALRLEQAVRETDAVGRDHYEFDDTVARLGGDEFTVLLADLRSAEDAARVAQRLIEKLARPFFIAGNELVVTASVGIALFPSDGHDAAALLMNADAAMYRAKQAGSNTYRFYASEVNSAALARFSLEQELRRALEHGEFVLHYQPQVDTDSGALCGLEALIRWQHPQRGLLLPGQFIALAEEIGLIVPIGQWVLQAACGQLAAWRAAGLALPQLAVNLASPSFRTPGLAAQVSATLREHAIDARALTLEVTETMLMSDTDSALRVLCELRERGVRLAIDDFGTGYSSLSYLRRFAIDELKIDRSFVRDMVASRDAAAIAAAIVSLGHSLNLALVAEGIEAREQASALRAMGCATMQGFLFGRPLAPQATAALLADPRGFARSVRERLAQPQGVALPAPAEAAHAALSETTSG